MSDVAALIERVRNATGPDRELDRAIQKALDIGPTSFTQDEFNHWPLRFTASVDAALALVERVLPGWRYGVSCHSIRDGLYEDGPHAGRPKHADGFRAHVTERSPLRPMPNIADAKTAPIAILVCLLTALLAQEQSKTPPAALANKGESDAT